MGSHSALAAVRRPWRAAGRLVCALLPWLRPAWSRRPLPRYPTLCTVPGTRRRHRPQRALVGSLPRHAETGARWVSWGAASAEGGVSSKAGRLWKCRAPLPNRPRRGTLWARRGSGTRGLGSFSEASAIAPRASGVSRFSAERPDAWARGEGVVFQPGRQNLGAAPAVRRTPPPNPRLCLGSCLRQTAAETHATPCSRPALRVGVLCTKPASCACPNGLLRTAARLLKHVLVLLRTSGPLAARAANALGKQPSHPSPLKSLRADIPVVRAA